MMCELAFSLAVQTWLIECSSIWLSWTVGYEASSVQRFLDVLFTVQTVLLDKHPSRTLTHRFLIWKIVPPYMYALGSIFRKAWAHLVAFLTIIHYWTSFLVNLGLAWYARTYHLASSSCKGYNCTVSVLVVLLSRFKRGSLSRWLAEVLRATARQHPVTSRNSRPSIGWALTRPHWTQPPRLTGSTRWVLDVHRCSTHY